MHLLQPISTNPSRLDFDLLTLCNLTTCQICAVGWEPNPKHEEYLKKMNQAYKSCGFKAHIYTKTGVGATDRVSQFVENIRDVRDWGAHVVDRTERNIRNTEQQARRISSSSYPMTSPKKSTSRKHVRWPSSLASRWEQ